MVSEPESIWKLGTELGEGPLWSANDETLWLVDIKLKHIHRFDARAGKGTTFGAPDQTGFLAPLSDGRFIAGVKTGLHTFDPKDGSFKLRHKVEPDRPGNRLNDGAVDAAGRLWFGSMDDAEKDKSGRLYRLDDQGPTPMDDGYCITNGPAFSPDGKTLYHTDTLERVTYAFDLADDGGIANKRDFIRYEHGAGYPDGPAVDAEGCVWISLFAGWGARRYSPKGEQLEFVRFPCANVTKIAFGGSDLKTAYATTARKNLDEKARAEQPLAGSLFRFRVDVPGLPQNVVRHG